jgi:hypothetical protein
LIGGTMLTGFAQRCNNKNAPHENHAAQGNHVSHQRPRSLGGNAELANFDWS